MRRLYFLLAAFALASMTLPANAKNVTPDVANFTFTINASTHNVVFTNASTLGNEPGERRAHWSFGDGTGQWTGALDGTQHQYQSAGTYAVCLKIFRIYTNNNDSVLSAQICKTVVIQSAVCGANFETVNTASTPLGKYFVAQPSHSENKKPVRICWTFGDNRDTCIQYSTTYTGAYGVYHLYNQPGAYNVCVNILYDGGCEAHSCHTIQTNSPDSCRANFETVAASATTLGRYFIAAPWHNHNKKPVRVCWIFGDNRDTCIQYSTSYTGPYNVFHLYSQPGTYNVCVKILYDGGCEAQNCHPIQTGEADSCRADFERIPVTATNNVLFTSFRALPWHNNNKKPSKICWRFGDNTDTCINYGQDYNGPYTVNHHYQQSGQYEVCVKIIYYGGCEAYKCKPVVAPQTSCSVRVFMLTPSANSLSRVLYAFAHSAPPRPVERICWIFGDGTDTCIMATSSNPPPLMIPHTYPAPGVYRTCVRVLFQGGCVAEDCIEVVIRSNSHLCGGYMTDSMVAPHTIKFKGFAVHQPNDPVVSFRWTFGDGSTGVGPEITHTYNVGGEYRVCLTIVTQSGCETKICNTVRVAGNNQPILQLSPNPVINILHALFLSTHNETVTIKIINSSGVIVRQYTRPATTGINNWDFDLATLLPGTYLFSIQSPNQTASAIFVKH